MADFLSRGAIMAIVNGQNYTKPVFQLLALKKLSSTHTSGSTNDRFRFLLSDGLHTNSAMLAVHLNGLIADNTMEVYSLIQLDRYVCNLLPDNRPVLIILDVSILQRGSEIGSKIGSPISIFSANQQREQALIGGQQRPVPSPYNNDADKNKNRPMDQRLSAGGCSANSTSCMAVGQGAGSLSKKVHPISSLNPYQNRWTIKARVLNKGGVRTWSNSRGEGKLFQMNLVDNSGEIQCTAYKAECDKWYDTIQNGKLYYISKCSLKMAKRQYTSINNDYEMVMHTDTLIEEAPEDLESSQVPKYSYDFKTIAQLEDIPKDTIIDIIGVVRGVADVTIVKTRKTNKELPKRDIQLLDETNSIVNMTLWDKQAEDFQASVNSIVVVKGARISDFGGRSLSTLQSSFVEVNPDIPRVHQLKGWFENEGCHQEAQLISSGAFSCGEGTSNWLYLADVLNHNLGQGATADYFTTKGTITYIKKEYCMYMACPSQECNKKVIENGDGLYRCVKCARDYPNFQYRLLLSVNIADATESQWVKCFENTAESILGQTAEYMASIRDQDKLAFDQIFLDATFKPYIFKMRVKNETYNDETSLQWTCLNAQPMDYKEHSRKLIMDIRNLAQE